MLAELLFLTSCGTAVAGAAAPEKPDTAKIEKKAPAKESPPCNPFPPLAL